MSSRCKFRCVAITKRIHWAKETKFIYAAEFIAVTDGSPENKSFFASTPSGKLEIGTIREDVFEPGQFYYLDLSEAPE